MKFIVEADSVDELISALEQLIASKRPVSHLDRPIDDLRLTVRTENCLKAEGIRTIVDLSAKSVNDIRKIPNIGTKSIDEIVTSLRVLGIHLRDF